MKNLKDYLKLIFAAVVCFVMKLLPDKKYMVRVPVETGIKENEKAGRKLCGLNNVLTFVGETDYWNKEWNKEYSSYVKKRSSSGWKIHWHKPVIRRKRSEFVYYNTG